jgi:transposase
MKKKQQVRNYTSEYKAEAVKLVMDNNLTLTDAAARLGMSMKTLSAWVARVRRGGVPETKPNLIDSSAKAEINRLKKALALAEMERDILKKATAYFAKESQQGTHS